MLRRLLLALSAVAALAAPALAQSLPYLPPSTVVGRLPGTAGPYEAIPFTTFQSALFPTPTRAGDILYYNGSTWVSLAGNNSGTQFLQESSSGVPSWVASLAGLGVPTNTLNSKITNYTIANTDCGKTVQMGTGATGQLTVTLPSVSGFDGKCVVTILNGDAYSQGVSRGKVLSGFPADVFYILFPGQVLEMGIVNGAWKTLQPTGRWMQGGVWLYVNSSTSGGDTNNDCLSSATPCQTINHALNGILYPRVDSVQASPTIWLAGAQIYNECVIAQGQLVGINVGFIKALSGTGLSGGPTWKPAVSCPGNSLFQNGDGAEWELQNILMTNAGGTSGIYGYFGHQTAIVDFLSGMNFGTFPGAAPIGGDNNTMVNLNGTGGYSITGGGGTSSYFITVGPASTVNECGVCTTTFVASPAIGILYNLSGAGVTLNIGPSHAYSGAATITNACIVNGPSAVSLNGAAPTGTAACSAGTSHGGQVY